jgi:hypothetical protein
MNHDKRKWLPPVPDNLERLLSLNQFRALSVVTKYGWKLAFVRREMLEEAIPVIVNSSGDKYAEIETMGGINLNPGIKMRG